MQSGTILPSVSIPSAVELNLMEQANKVLPGASKALINAYIAYKGDLRKIPANQTALRQEAEKYLNNLTFEDNVPLKPPFPEGATFNYRHTPFGSSFGISIPFK